MPGMSDALTWPTATVAQANSFADTTNPSVWPDEVTASTAAITRCPGDARQAERLSIHVRPGPRRSRKNTSPHVRQFCYRPRRLSRERRHLHAQRPRLSGSGGAWIAAELRRQVRRTLGFAFWRRKPTGWPIDELTSVRQQHHPPMIGRHTSLPHGVVHAPPAARQRMYNSLRRHVEDHGRRVEARVD